MPKIKRENVRALVVKLNLIAAKIAMWEYEDPDRDDLVEAREMLSQAKCAIDPDSYDD